MAKIWRAGLAGQLLVFLTAASVFGESQNPGECLKWYTPEHSVVTAVSSGPDNWTDMDKKCEREHFGSNILQRGYGSLRQQPEECSLVPLRLGSAESGEYWVNRHGLAPERLTATEMSNKSPATSTDAAYRFGAWNLMTSQWTLVDENFKFSCAYCEMLNRKNLSAPVRNDGVDFKQRYDVTVAALEYIAEDVVHDDLASVLNVPVDSIVLTGQNTWLFRVTLPSGHVLPSARDVPRTERIEVVYIENFGVCPAEVTSSFSWPATKPAEVVVQRSPSDPRVLVARECVLDGTARADWTTPTSWREEMAPCDSLDWFDFAVEPETKLQDFITAGNLYINPDYKMYLHSATIVGLLISTLSMLAISLNSLCVKDWAGRVRNKSLVFLALSVFLNVIALFLIIFIPAVKDEGVCVFIGALLHYAQLACFSWIFVLSGLMLMKLTAKVSTGDIPHLIIKLFIAAFGIPLLIVGLVLAIDYESYHQYTSEDPDEPSAVFCYPVGVAYWAAVIGPIAVIWLATATTLGMVVLKFNAKIVDCNWMSVRRIAATIFIFILFTLNWTFGMFAYQVLGLAYGVFLTLPVQSISMFLFLVVLEKKKNMYEPD